MFEYNLRMWPHTRSSVSVGNFVQAKDEQVLLARRKHHVRFRPLPERQATRRRSWSTAEEWRLTRKDILSQTSLRR